MVEINLSNLASVLSGKGVKLCVGVGGKKCFRPRNGKERLCKECHREVMREWRRKKSGRPVRVEPEDNVQVVPQSKGIAFTQNMQNLPKMRPKNNWDGFSQEEILE